MVEVMDTLTSIQSILGGGSSQPLGSGTPPSAHDNSNTLGTTGLHPDTGVKHTGAGSSGTLHQITLGLEYELKGAGQTLKEVKATVQSIEKRLEATVPSPSKSRFDAHRTSPSDTALDSNASALNDEVLDVLLAVKAQLNAALPGLGKGLGKVSVGQNAFMENVKMQGADLGPLERRLDDLMKVGKSSQAILRDRMIGKDLLAEVQIVFSFNFGSVLREEHSGIPSYLIDGRGSGPPRTTAASTSRQCALPQRTKHRAFTPLHTPDVFSLQPRRISGSKHSSTTEQPKFKLLQRALSSSARP